MPNPTSKVTRTARGQHGLVTWSQARAILGAHEAEHWRRTKRVVPVQPRVHRLAGYEPTWHQALLAAVLATDGVVSHRAAAELWGMVDREGWVEVTAPAGGVRLHPPAIVHVGSRHREVRAGVPLTDPLETLCDLGQVAPTWQLNAALDAALGTRLVSIHAVEALLGGEVTRREEEVAALRAVLRPRTLPSADEEADHAARVARLLDDPALGLARLWHEVWHEGRFVARADGADPDQRLAVVVEHRGMHGDRWQTVPDVRATRLRRAGWQVAVTTSTELRRHPGRLAARLARVASRGRDDRRPRR